MLNIIWTGFFLFAAPAALYQLLFLDRHAVSCGLIADNGRYFRGYPDQLSFFRINI